MRGRVKGRRSLGSRFVRLAWGGFMRRRFMRGWFKGRWSLGRRFMRGQFLGRQFR